MSTPSRAPSARPAACAASPAGARLALALATVVAVVAMPRGAWLAYAAAAAAVLAAARLARVRLRDVGRRLVVAAPFVVGVAGLAWLQRGGGVAAGTLVAKSAVCVLAMAVLTASTPFADLLDVLRRLRVPALLVTTLGLTERYLAVLGEEAARLRRARRARTFAGSRRAAWTSAATVAAHLFVRTTLRAERVHAAMTARGGR
ncbi:MAG: CbiQ family ECF transporter T component [Planctomycetota bacterium]